ncbi:MAG TPA: pyridoxamine 5'-phosphate oxidase family protein [Terriglobales bacterium]|nr:pyridoxamine 5'-phosphate oxidase family protein [Terriglobales bacterium]
MPADSAPSARTQVRRLPQRGAYDRATLDAILDAAFICHVGFVADGHPVVIPTGYGRRGDHLYIHGSAASHMLHSLQAGIELCLTVTLLDGLVLARSVFHHSVNYRSVVVFGRATVVEEASAKLRALEAITDHILAGRWAAARPPSPRELKATLVLELPLAEASAKIRTGPPSDEPEDYALPVWAGVVPAALTFGEPLADPKLTPGIAMPAHVRGRS